jgi:sugar lactone lactonase YvrE
LTLFAGLGFLAGCDDNGKMVPVSRVLLDQDSLELTVGSIEKLHATVEPANATYQELIWESSNTDVARVDSNGFVSAFAVGTAIISARNTQDSSKMATCNVAVKGKSKDGEPEKKDEEPEKKDDDPEPLLPVILGFSPTEAGFGTLLTIQGENFSAVPSENSVTLNGVAATIRTATPDRIVVEVPKSKLSSGPIFLTVKGKAVRSSTEFTYVPTATTVSTLAGSCGHNTHGNTDGTGGAARFDSPHAITTDASNNLYVADSVNHSIRKITPQGVVTTVAGGTYGFLNSIGTDAQFRNTQGVAVDTATGSLYVADWGNHRIRGITIPQGAVSTFSGSGTQGFLDGSATIAQFNFDWPQGIGIAIDKDRNLYVSDTLNHRIRKITPSGTTSTFAGSGAVGNRRGGFADGPGNSAQFDNPRGIAIDAEGNLYVVEGWGGRIRKITPQGVVSTFAGPNFVDSATGNTEQLCQPSGITIDKEGNLYVADAGMHCIRKITPQGAVSTVTGNSIPVDGPICGRGGDFRNGDAKSAMFSSPHGITIDSAGNLYVVDNGNNCIRKILME